MLQTIVSDNDLYRMFGKQGPDGIAAHRGDRNRGASTLENQYRFITRFSRRGFRCQQQRVMRRFTTISPRYHARAYTALLQLLHQPDHHRRFAVAARRKITDNHNGHRRAPGPLHPKTIKQTDNAAHQAVEPGERQKQQPQRGFTGPDACNHSPNCIL